jgi:PKD repeat protein
VIAVKVKLAIVITFLGMSILLLICGCATINSAPVAGFTCNPSSGKAPLTVSFDASSSYDSDGEILSYSWNFADSGSDTGVTTSHTYTEVGTYTARLTVTDDDGATDFDTQTIQVSSTPTTNNPPTASFTASPTSGQAPLVVDFNGSGSSDSDGYITSYAWAFGDGESSSGGVTAIHTYNTAGTYTALLTVADNDGATDSSSQTIEAFTPSHEANC